MKILFVGAGHMGGALIQGLLKSGTSKGDIIVCDANEERRGEFGAMGLEVADDVREVAGRADIVVLAVKPNSFEGLLSGLRGITAPVFVSIAAGITIGYIKSFLGDVKVVRTMPNTPALVGDGVTVISWEEPVTASDLAAVERIFRGVGQVEYADEALMNAVVALNGSGPAYMYMMIEAMAEFGASHGVDADLAKRLAAGTMLGAARMVLQSAEEPGTLREQVCSKGGTTERAVASLLADDFKGAVKRAMEKCAERSAEMER